MTPTYCRESLKEKIMPFPYRQKILNKMNNHWQWNSPCVNVLWRTSWLFGLFLPCFIKVKGRHFLISNTRRHNSEIWSNMDILCFCWNLKYSFNAQLRKTRLGLCAVYNRRYNWIRQKNNLVPRACDPLVEERVILSCYDHQMKGPIKSVVLIRTKNLIGCLISWPYSMFSSLYYN